MSTSRQFQVLNVVTTRAGLTAREYATMIAKTDPTIDAKSVGRRLPELEKKGFVSRHVSRDCSISGQNAQTWISTYNGLRAVLRNAV